MKKTLLALSLIASSCFFAYAQVQIGQVQINTQTGQYGAQGTVNGIPVSIGNTSLGSLFSNNQNGLLGLLALAQTILSRLVPFLVGLAVVVFFWFLVEFIWKGRDNPAKQKEALSGMGWSILAIFVMVSVWGIIAFIGNIFGINQGGSMPAFRLPGE